MDESNNYKIIYDNNSFYKKESINISHKKLFLPKIRRENIYFKKKFNKISNNKILKPNSKIKIFLTSPKEEEQEKNNNLFTLNNKTNNEDKIIHKILSQKIIINKKGDEQENKNLIFQRNIILKKYMNEALLYRKSIFQRNKIHVGKIFKMPYSYDKYYFKKEFLNNDKITIDSSIDNSRLNERKKLLKKYKTLEKNIELESLNIYFKPNYKMLNCGLKYKYNTNQKEINEINSILNNLHEDSKATFDGFRNQTYKIIDKASQKKE